METHPEIELHLAKIKAERKARTRSNLQETLAVAAIGGALAFWAYQTIAHAVLFAFIAYGISAVGNRVLEELWQVRVKAESSAIMDRLGL